MRLNKKTNGFTIVELLIVIVIIAILAAITIVAYNGIQQRATNSKMVAMVSQYSKLLASYAAEKSTYPGVIGASTTNNLVCLDGSSTCWVDGDATKSATLRTELSAYSSSFPSAANSVLTYGTQTMEVGGSSRTGYYIVYVTSGNSPCPAITGLIYINMYLDSNNTNRRCRMGLPNPS